MEFSLTKSTKKKFDRIGWRFNDVWWSKISPTNGRFRLSNYEAQRITLDSEIEKLKTELSIHKLYHDRYGCPNSWSEYRRCKKQLDQLMTSVGEKLV